MARKPIQIQEAFLFGALKERRPVTVVLLGGEMVKGRIKRFDAYTLVIDTGHGERFLYKSAVAAVAIATQQSEAASRLPEPPPPGTADPGP